LPEQVGSSRAEQVPPTMHVVPATHQCCLESGCLADFKTKFVIAKHATGRQAGRGRTVACLSKLMLAGAPQQVAASLAAGVKRGLLRM
jgi:hypothetical protein